MSSQRKTRPGEAINHRQLAGIPLAMPTARWVGCGFVLLQALFCFWLGVGANGRLIAVLLVGLSILLGRNFRLSKSIHTLIVVASGLLFGVNALSRFFGPNSAGLLDLFEMMAEFLLTVQALELLRQRADSLTGHFQFNYLPGLGLLVVTLLLVSREVPFSLTTLNRLLPLMVLLVVVDLRPDLWLLLVGERAQRQKGLTLVAVAFLAMISGNMFQGEVVRLLPPLQMMFRSMQPTREEFDRVFADSQARFVEQVDLSSISRAQLDKPDEMVFRVDGQTPPGYMRTLSFEQFDGLQWSNPWSVDRRSSGARVLRISSVEENPPGLPKVDRGGGRSLFAFPEREDGDYGELTVSVPANHGRLVPLPLTTSFVLAEQGGRARQLLLDPHGNAWPNSILNEQYRVFFGKKSTWQCDDDYLQRLLSLPIADAPYLTQKAQAICASTNTFDEKLAAIESHFIENFEYAFDPTATRSPTNESPLKNFLERRPPGHCEYFATASALLLRALGIPCRLSTGYLVYEMNDDREYYFARNRDAHAWVEAYDSASDRWQLVESTPGIRDLVRRLTSAEKIASVTDLVGTRGSNGSSNPIYTVILPILEQIRVWVMQVLALRFAWLLPLALAALLWSLSLLSRFRRQSDTILSRAVRQADARAQRLGFRRQPNETCLQFANRLESIKATDLDDLADWYRAHSKQRYLPQQPSIEAGNADG